MVVCPISTVFSTVYVRFASIYREFKEVGEFVDQIKSMDKT